MQRLFESKAQSQDIFTNNPWSSDPVSVFKTELTGSSQVSFLHWSVFFRSVTLVHRFSEASLLHAVSSLLIYLDQAKAQMCFGKEAISDDFKEKNDRSQTVLTSERRGGGGGRASPPSHTFTHSSHVPHEVLVGLLLRVPLLPLLPGLHLRQQRLPVRLIRFDDVLELLHEEQLQHPLIRVQVGQLE